MCTQSKAIYSWGGFSLLSLMLLFLAPAQSHAAVFTVNSTADVTSAATITNCQTGVGQCTLRAAVQAANASLNVADTIVLSAGTYTLALPGAGEDAAATGDLDIVAVGGALTITGVAGPAATIIDGGAIDRVFQTIGAATVTISGVTIRNGNVIGNGGAIDTAGGTNLTLTNVVMTGNTSSIEGGAINIGAGASVTTMNTVVITNNTSGAGGDIIAHGAGGTLTISNSTISGNHEVAMSNKATSAMTLTNVTISGNTSAGGVGAIDNLGTATLQNCTVTLNTAAGGAGNGGIRNQALATALNLRNTIISSNTPTNCIPTLALVSQGNNIDDGNSCALAGAGDAINTDPLLAALADNTGAVQTHALLLGSPAIDTGATGTVCPPTDARGIARPVDGNIDGLVNCDKGAFEFRPQKIIVVPVAPFDFGAVTVATTADHAVTLTNSGDGDLILGTIAAADPLAAPFSIPANTCTAGFTLKHIPVPAANSCIITTRFAPAVEAPAVDTFDIPSNDPITPTVSLSLSGVGSAVPVPIIVVTDSLGANNDHLLPFGAIAINASADATVTIANAGSANLALGTIASADPLDAPFSITSNTCSASIAPSTTCTLTVHFAPTANTEASDTFDIPISNVPGTTSITMTITGSGISATGNHAPSAPVLVAPTNGQTGVPMTMTFVWNKSVDPDGDAVTYHFSNCTDSTFAAVDCAPSTVASARGLWFVGLGSFGTGIILIGFVAKSGPRRRLMMLVISFLLLSGAFFASCHRSSSETPPPAPAEQISKR